MSRLLIEEGLPFEAIDAASGPEKTAPPLGHPFKMHRWWARRPLAMSRAIVLGSLVPDPGEAERARVFLAISQAARFKDVANRAAVEPLLALIQDAFPNRPPKVLDAFAGGGSIPLEALRLGCDTVAIDLNPVAHLFQRCVLEYPQVFGTPDALGKNSLAEEVREWATWVGNRAATDVEDVYPDDEDNATPLVWFWARTMVCQNPHCGKEYPLVKSWWLARGRRRVWLDPASLGSDCRVQVKHGEPPDSGPINRGTVSGGTATCPRCGAVAGPRDLRAHGTNQGFGLRALAVLSKDAAGGRSYREAQPRDSHSVDVAEKRLRELEDFAEGTSAIPDEAPNPAQYRKFQMMPYGIKPFSGLYTSRQALTLHALCAAAREAHDRMLTQGMPEDRARAVAAYLGLLIDRVADNNSAFATWENSGEKIRNTFTRQGLAMVWDFTEINPFADGSGGWSSGIEFAARAIERCSETGSKPARVERGDAQHLSSIPDAHFDAVVVDPPYYDAVQYADLSDFFYVWLKRSVGHLYPELFSAPTTPKSQEIIENYADPKSDAYLSSDDFEERLGRAISELRRVVKPDGVVTIVFAHTEADAWERLLRALLDADLVVSTSWPMESEKRGRSTANVSAVLGSSVVLVCRPRTTRELAFYDDVVRELDKRIGDRLDEFERLGLHGADYLVSAIGPAFEVFGQYATVQRLNGESVTVGELLALARRTVARHAMRRLLGSEALAAVDEVSLFYLTWRWAYGSARIPVDEAQKLGKAFNVEANELGGVDGLIETSRESYALRGPDDRKRVKLGVSPSLVDVLHVACKLFEQGRRTELAEVLAGSGFTEEPAFWASARAIAESLPDGDRERILLVNFLGGQSQTVEAARNAAPNETLRLFEVET